MVVVVVVVGGDGGSAKRSERAKGSDVFRVLWGALGELNPNVEKYSKCAQRVSVLAFRSVLWVVSPPPHPCPCRPPSPSISPSEKSPPAKPAVAQVPGSPIPAPFITARTISWMKRKGGFAKSFSVSFGFGKRGCSSAAVLTTSPDIPTSAAERKTRV